MDQHTKTVLITGASGYLGKLIAAILLHREEVALLLPVRGNHTADAVREAIGYEFEAWGGAFTASVASRIHVVALPEMHRLSELDGVVAKLGVDDIVHAAGCLDYFDDRASQVVNVELTARLLDSALRWRMSRFVYVSTAFSSGYLDGVVPERLHDGVGSRDPTVYTRTKRDAEHLVASAGLPWQIIRPSIVIGDSRDGHYSGKQYGLYQLWSGIERLLCSEWEPHFHVVAPAQPLNVIHQDAFQQAFHRAWKSSPSGTVLNVVARDELSPTLRELWDLWFSQCFKPEEVTYYENVNALPVETIPRRQRALMALASVNLEIGAHAWRFERRGIEAMHSMGLELPDATLHTVDRCQQVFMANSSRVQKFMQAMRRNERDRRSSRASVVLE
jgi:nucleoside-diphosphate-sugar epimerase